MKNASKITEIMSITKYIAPKKGIGIKIKETEYKMINLVPSFSFCELFYFVLVAFFPQEPILFFGRWFILF